MKTPEKQTLTCSNCGGEVSSLDGYCSRCGGLFKENFVCANHSDEEAEGVCVICRKPMCGDCGTWVLDVFLCSQHEDYEFFKGMARVYGVSDEAQAHHAHACLEQAGLHPFVYTRKASPLSLGSVDYGRLINEIAVLVPAAEVIAAEKTLADLGITS